MWDSNITTYRTRINLRTEQYVKVHFYTTQSTILRDSELRPQNHSGHTKSTME